MSTPLPEDTAAVMPPVNVMIVGVGGQVSVAKGIDTGHSDIDLIVVGTASLLALSESLHLLEQTLGRPVNFSLYEPAEWTRLLEVDPIMAQISKGSTLRIL